MTVVENREIKKTLQQTKESIKFTKYMNSNYKTCLPDIPLFYRILLVVKWLYNYTVVECRT